jgi:choloylglycine hydrolase
MSVSRMSVRKSLVLLMSMLFLSACLQEADACTGIMLRSTDGSVAHGRTVEYGIPIDSSVVVVPQGHEFVGKTPLGPGLKYKTKYAAVGVIAFKDLALADGLNEKGLAAGAFYFPTFAKYADINDRNVSRALSPFDFVNWILAQFDTVADVKRAIENGDVVIAPTVIEGWGTTAPPLHYIVYDSSGKSIVIEPLDGKLKVHDNPFGVLTNSPDFDWHMTNLRNYISLRPEDVISKEIAGVKLEKTGLGSGMVGLPGDFTPPSRFVRAVQFATTSIPVKNTQQNILQVFHILNNFDIPRGVVREMIDGKTYSDSTQVTVARDPKNLRYYYKTYDDQTIRMVDMKKFDLNAKSPKMLDTKSSQPVVDMSSDLK